MWIFKIGYSLDSDSISEDIFTLPITVILNFSLWVKCFTMLSFECQLCVFSYLMQMALLR